MSISLGYNAGFRLTMMPLVDATQVFGGRALTVTGMGKFIENVRTTYLFLLSLLGFSPRKLTYLCTVPQDIRLRC